MQSGGLEAWRLFKGGQRSPSDCTIPTLICLIEVVGGEGSGGGAPKPGMLKGTNKYQGHLATLPVEGKANLLFGDVSWIACDQFDCLIEV